MKSVQTDSQQTDKQTDRRTDGRTDELRTKSDQKSSLEVLAEVRQKLHSFYSINIFFLNHGKRKNVRENGTFKLNNRFAVIRLGPVCLLRCGQFSVKVVVRM